VREAWGIRQLAEETADRGTGPTGMRGSPSLASQVTHSDWPVIT